MRLTLPTLKYRKSFLKGLEELEAKKETNSLNETGDPKTVFAYIRTTRNYSKGIGLPKGWVPHTTYWLTDSGEYIGDLNIRHRLNPSLKKVGGHIGYRIRPSKRNQGYGKKILGLSLKKARNMGLKKILMTCDKTNIASKRIIELNGGKLEKERSQGKGKPKKLFYWIRLK